ncbi:nucleotidyltransferase domain-containing protein [Candidatus Bathyarchaeota archaeon]|nr:nucleotidyltransferase domain-containing protein [Candidatus Bathyarchaeota archaeon]
MEEILNSLRRASKELSDLLNGGLAGLALFGSWARLEAEEDSDVDVFVVVDGHIDLDLRAKIYRVLSKHLRRPITLVTASQRDLSSESLELTPLLVNIIADAIIIHDRNGFLESIVNLGRRLIEKAEIIRYKTADGKYGWARKNGKPLSKVELEK